MVSLAFSGGLVKEITYQSASRFAVVSRNTQPPLTNAAVARDTDFGCHAASHLHKFLAATTSSGGWTKYHALRDAGYSNSLCASYRIANVASSLITMAQEPSGRDPWVRVVLVFESISMSGVNGLLFWPGANCETPITPEPGLSFGGLAGRLGVLALGDSNR